MHMTIRTRRSLALVVLALLGSSAAILAQRGLNRANPLSGTWTLDTARSTFGSAVPIKSQTRTYEVTGDRQRCRIESLDTTGVRIAYGYDAGLDGRDYTMTGSGMPGGADMIALTRVDERRTSASLKKAGTVVMTATLTVSPDGKVLTIERAGAASATLVFDKGEPR
jgi:hypothetical protein